MVIYDVEQEVNQYEYRGASSILSTTLYPPPLSGSLRAPSERENELCANATDHSNLDIPGFTYGSAACSKRFLFCSFKFMRKVGKERRV